MNLSTNRLTSLGLGAVISLLGTLVTAAERPNILWILSEDASPHIGCYGETTIRTPHLDRLAREGVRFENAFVTCPVCSPSRSALVAGMFQTTFGSHNHRSGNADSKAGGNERFYDSYRVPASLTLVPELFTQAGYYVVNGGKAKTDYNFIPRSELYRGRDWQGRASGQPFFAQIQLAGGKARRAKVAQPTDPASVRLPPYYPEHPVLRQDWADYLNSWVKCDEEVGGIVRRLKEEKLLEATVIFFLTDHGISHVRGKQFLYDEGIRVPLIVRFPEGREAGTVRRDLVSHIDIAAASLDLAGIPIPEYIQGRPLFAADHQPREMVVSARDRCDETVDLLRSVRTERFKYLRNFLSHIPHMQPNQYKDGKAITRTMRQLHAEGKLNELQDRIFAPTRPVEELYDLENDPHETVNLARRPEYKETVRQLRESLYDWMVENRDVGLIPEPILDEMGAASGSKYAVLQQPENANLVREILRTVEAGEQGDVKTLKSALSSSQPAVRYWAAVWLGNVKAHGAINDLKSLLKEESSGAVHVAAARALAQLGQSDEARNVLAMELQHPNLTVGFYAVRALESMGEEARPLLPQIQACQESSYDSTRRVARRLTAELQ